MKNLMVVLSLIVFLILSCQKEYLFDENGNYGKGTALLNGSYYEGSVGTLGKYNYCSPDTCITIKLYHFFKTGYEGNIHFGRIPLKTGKFQLYFNPDLSEDGNYELSYSESQGDLVGGVYFTYQADTSNWINIKKLDLKNGDIEGSFQGAVVRHTAFTSSGEIPDTIRITDGKFYGRINWNK